MPFQKPETFDSRRFLTNKDLAVKPAKLSIPYVIRNCLLINEGIHNGDYYPSHELQSQIKQFEGLPLFKDHHPNQIGGTVSDWSGEIRRPKWNSKLKGVMGDLWVMDENLAKHIHYGAKFGLSVTVDADIRSDHHKGKRFALDPIFRSCSFVLDPAVRQTMLNERKQNLEVKYMEVENKPERPPVDEAILKKLEALETTIAELAKKKKPEEEEKYPYPKKKSSLEDLSNEELAAELARRKKKKELPEEPEKMESEKISELQAELDKFRAKELEAKIDTVMDKEVKIGLLEAKDSEEGKARAEELKKLSADALSAVEANLDRTLNKMEAIDSEPAPVSDSQPAKLAGATQRRELSHIDLDAARNQANDKLLGIMLAAQGRAG